MASSEGKVGKKECKENIAVGGKGRGRWGKQQGSLHHTCTIVHKQYQPYTLRIIYLTYFFCEILCPERQNYLKNLRFLFFFALRKKHSGIKYFGKIFIFGRYFCTLDPPCTRNTSVQPSPPRGNVPQVTFPSPPCLLCKGRATHSKTGKVVGGSSANRSKTWQWSSCPWRLVG